MTPEELITILGNVTLQLGDIMSFGLGALCAIAFVISAHMRWDR